MRPLRLWPCVRLRVKLTGEVDRRTVRVHTSPEKSHTFPRTDKNAPRWERGFYWASYLQKKIQRELSKKTKIYTTQG